MHNALFIYLPYLFFIFGKYWKWPQGWGREPQSPLPSGGWVFCSQSLKVVTPITCYRYFLAGVYNVITAEKEQM